MTPDEVCRYLGFPAGTIVVQQVIDGLRDIPCPHTAEEHIAVFRAFLACAVPPAISKAATGGTAQPGPAARQGRDEWLGKLAARSAYEQAEMAYGRLCPECGISWYQPSPDCPHSVTNLHPLTPRDRP